MNDHHTMKWFEYTLTPIWHKFYDIYLISVSKGLVDESQETIDRFTNV